MVNTTPSDLSNPQIQVKIRTSQEVGPFSPKYLYNAYKNNLINSFKEPDFSSFFKEQSNNYKRIVRGRTALLSSRNNWH